jgi:circadian clock protein KaiB
MTTPRDSTLLPSQDDLGRFSDNLYRLTLFVSGASDLSALAIANAKELCETHLAGRYHLSIVDVHDNPSVLNSHVFATPTLVKDRPLPVRMLVGDLSSTEKVLLALDLPGASDVSDALG